MISKYDIIKYAKQFEDLAKRGKLKEKAEKLIHQMVKEGILDKGELIDVGCKLYRFQVYDGGDPGDRIWPYLAIDKGNASIGLNVFQIEIHDTVEKYVISNVYHRCL